MIANHACLLSHTPVRGLHYAGPALAVTLWTQAASIPGNLNQARAGSVVVLGSFINMS